MANRHPTWLRLALLPISLGWVAFVGVGITDITSCTQSEDILKSEPPCPGDSNCATVADPCLRRVVSTDCKTPHDCPSGTECVTPSNNTPSLNPNFDAGHGHHCCPLTTDNAADGCGVNTTGGAGVAGTAGEGGAGGAASAGAGGEMIAGAAGVGGIGVGEPMDLGAKRVCSVPGPDEIDRYALARGFDVLTFALEESSDDDQPKAFSYVAPEDTIIVTCAVFRCLPDVKGPPEPHGTPGQPENASHLDTPTIVNFDQCVLNYQQYPGREGTTIPKEMPPPIPPRVAQCAYVARDTDIGYENAACSTLACPGALYQCPEEPLRDVSWQQFATSCPITTRLLLGCWSMDNHRVIASTLLEDLAPSDVANFCRFYADQGATPPPWA
jgi:hypothetical protein